MSYFTSGEFRAAVGKAMGQELTRTEPDDDDDGGESLDDFPDELGADLEAIQDLARNWSPAELCVLRWGDFCSVPALTGAERDEVLEDWFDGDAVATDFVLSAVDVLNGGGGFYIVVHPDGRMGLVCEDPYSFDPLDCTLPQFFQALVAAHHAVCTDGVAAAKAELCKAVDERTANLMLAFAERLAPA